MIRCMLCDSVAEHFYYWEKIKKQPLLKVKIEHYCTHHNDVYGLMSDFVNLYRINEEECKLIIIMES